MVGRKSRPRNSLRLDGNQARTPPANAEEVERALHIAFAPHRINPKREFFKIDPEQAIAILRLLHTEDATTEVEQQPVTVDQQSLAAAEQLKSRRPNLNFVEMGIPIGSILESVDNGSTVTAVGPRKVKLGDDEVYLTEATRRLLNLEYSVAPGPHWSYNGRRMAELYEETYLRSE